jgi:hypothetical protein
LSRRKDPNKTGIKGTQGVLFMNDIALSMLFLCIIAALGLGLERGPDGVATGEELVQSKGEDGEAA